MNHSPGTMCRANFRRRFAAKNELPQKLLVCGTDVFVFICVHLCLSVVELNRRLHRRYERVHADGQLSQNQSVRCQGLKVGDVAGGQSGTASDGHRRNHAVGQAARPASGLVLA